MVGLADHCHQSLINVTLAHCLFWLSLSLLLFHTGMRIGHSHQDGHESTQSGSQSALSTGAPRHQPPYGPPAHTASQGGSHNKRAKPNIRMTISV